MLQGQNNTKKITAVSWTKSNTKRNKIQVPARGRLGGGLGSKQQGKRKKERTTASHYYCRFRAPPIQLDENKQSRNYHSLWRVQGYSGTPPFTLSNWYLATRFTISFLHSFAAVSVRLFPPSRPPRFPWN